MVPWAWAVKGLDTVIGSVASMDVGHGVRLSTVLAAAVSCYRSGAAYECEVPCLPVTSRVEPTHTRAGVESSRRGLFSQASAVVRSSVVSRHPSVLRRFVCKIDGYTRLVPNRRTS